MITVSRSILVSAPRESVGLYLRDLEKLADYELKVDAAKATYPAPEEGFIEVSGRFLGLPWRGAFRVEFTKDGGFRSEMVQGPLKRMTGGFHLRQVSSGITALTHHETYHFSLLARPLSPLLRRWIGRSMELELGVIKEAAERLHRRLQLKNNESAI